MLTTSHGDLADAGGDLGRAADAGPASHALPPQRFQQLPPTELEEMREAHHAVGLELGTLLGMTTDWARTRWVAGPARGTVLPQFFVRVPGARPDRRTGELLTRRLTRRGWGGRLLVDADRFRIDARRRGLTLALEAYEAHEHTISLRVDGGVLAIGPTQKLHLLAGAYEDDDGS
ncbi:hypothetical protein [Litorihabitans aurantiacus]|uniref:Uncharacterized protein n=1 Tax=Litorihabitans aurantiacus TaxID=1930061 RepID=A0AA37UNJ0_9MICO|nr:hypothetical protein [Litorihabitans aurantiacus]GMA30338.1 hypothetical protein GCM10025875_03300 [Litorihabitans aurantiacus]